MLRCGGRRQPHDVGQATKVGIASRGEMRQQLDAKRISKCLLLGTAECFGGVPDNGMPRSFDLPAFHNKAMHL